MAVGRVQMLWCVGWLAALSAAAACASPGAQRAAERSEWRATFEKIHGPRHLEEITDEMVDNHLEYYCADTATDYVAYIDHVAQEYLPRDVTVDGASTAGIAAMVASAEATDCPGVIDRDEVAAAFADSYR